MRRSTGGSVRNVSTRLRPPQCSHTSTGRFVGDQMIITGTRVQDGKPVVARSVLTFGEDGRLGTVTTHSILGANDPVLTFSARYTKQ